MAALKTEECMNEQQQQTSHVERIAEELASWAGSGALIVDHMARWPSPVSQEVDASGTLTTLIRDTLAPIAERHAAADLATAAGVLADAIGTLGSEILRSIPRCSRRSRESGRASPAARGRWI